jgi:hypothetical protein
MRCTPDTIKSIIDHLKSRCTIAFEEFNNFIAMVNTCIIHYKNTQWVREWRTKEKLHTFSC